MDKVSIRFGSKLQKIIKNDSSFWNEPTLQTAFAFVAFFTTMTASGRVPMMTFKVRDCDTHLTAGLSPGTKALHVLQDVYKVTDRIIVEIEVGMIACVMRVSFQYYGRGRGQNPYMRFEGAVESDSVRKFPAFDLFPF